LDPSALKQTNQQMLQPDSRRPRALSRADGKSNYPQGGWLKIFKHQTIRLCGDESAVNISGLRSATIRGLLQSRENPLDLHHGGDPVAAISCGQLPVIGACVHSWKIVVTSPLVFASRRAPHARAEGRGGR
jgi:hypothetical protein